VDHLNTVKVELIPFNIHLNRNIFYFNCRKSENLTFNF